MSTIPDERTRNRLLRRVDWRFLLPDLAPDLVATDAHGPLREAMAMVWSRVVPVHDANGDATLFVASDATPAVLRAGFDALRPGGHAWIEWSSPIATRARITDRLAATGFDGVRCYWPWPPPARLPARFWIPLGSENVRAWFRGGHAPVRPPILRGGGRVLLALWNVVSRVGLHLPLCALAHKPATNSAAPPQTARRDAAHSPRAATNNLGVPEPLVAPLLDDWQSWDLGPSPRSVAWALQTLGPRAISKVIGLIFDDVHTVPRVVVKLPRTPEASAGLRNEARTLIAIHDGEAGHPAGVPRVLFTCDIEGAGHAVAETARPGTPLWRRASHAEHRPLALRVTTWLTAFTRATAPAADHAGAAPPLAPALFDRFEEFYDPILDRALAAEARALVAEVQQLPRVCEHRDLGPWNIVLGVDGTLGILDWESSELYGFPGPDLVYFLAYHAFFRDGAMRSKRFLRSYRTALDPRTPTGRVRDDCLRAFLDAHAIPERMLGPIAVLTWLLHADSDARRIRHDTGGTPTAAALRDSLFLRLWDIEARRALRGA